LLGFQEKFSDRKEALQSNRNLQRMNKRKLAHQFLFPMYNIQKNPIRHINKKLIFQFVQEVTIHQYRISKKKKKRKTQLTSTEDIKTDPSPFQFQFYTFSIHKAEAR